MKTYGGFLISQIRQLSGRYFDRILRESGIDAFNGAQGKILYVLWEKGPLTITQISRFTSLAKTTLTAMLDRMEAGGLVVRKPDLKNRRQIFIELTPAAQLLRDDYDRVSDQVNEVFYEGFTEEEIQTFENTLRRILANYEKRE